MATEYYTRPYIRFQPYLIGIGFGYLMYKMRGKQIHMHWTTNLLGWTCAILTGLAVIYGLYGTRDRNKFHEHGYPMFSATFYASFHRFL